MSEELTLKEIQKGWPQTLKLYLIGFFGSLILTAISFALAIAKPFSKTLLIVVLVLLALAQAFVQLIFFMHFGKEPHPRWMSVLFYFMALILAIVVTCTLWIMFDLDMRMMPTM